MTDITERKVGYGFGILGGVLIAIGALVAFVRGAVDLVVGSPFGAINVWSQAVILLVVGGLALFFAYLANHNWRDRPFASGVLLVVISLLGWAVLGFGADLIALLGAVFVFLAGVLYLLVPAKRALEAVVTA